MKKKLVSVLLIFMMLFCIILISDFTEFDEFFLFRSETEEDLPENSDEMNEETKLEEHTHTFNSELDATCNSCGYVHIEGDNVYLEEEPNDNKDTAMPILDHYDILGSLSDTDKYDVYSFHLESTSDVSITCRGTSDAFWFGVMNSEEYGIPDAEVKMSVDKEFHSEIRDDIHCRLEPGLYNIIVQDDNIHAGTLDNVDYFLFIEIIPQEPDYSNSVTTPSAYN